MRVECESCKAIVDASFVADGAALRATCPACAASIVVTPVAAPVAAPVAVERCPKCGTPRSGEAACTRCGLTAERMAAFAAAREAGVPDAVRDAWQRALEHWTDDATHAELRRLVAANDAYAWAAGRYRDEVRSRPGDPIGPRELDRIGRAAEATMRATASPPPPRKAQPGRATAIVIAMIGLAIVIGLVAAYALREKANAQPGALPDAPRLDPAHPLRPSG